MTDKEKKYENYRRMMLPEQLDRARRRYHGLLREARSLNMNWILTNKEMWDDLEDAA
jgi:hypothetical protein